MRGLCSRAHLRLLTLACAGVNHFFSRYSAFFAQLFYEKWKDLPTCPGRKFPIPAISAGHFRHREILHRPHLPMRRKIDG
jgi:hypothetical protein